MVKVAFKMKTWHDKEIDKVEKFWRNFLGQNIIKKKRKPSMHELDALDTDSEMGWHNEVKEPEVLAEEARSEF